MLNELQEKAVNTEVPFLFLLAGAGTGKTRVIVERIKYLLSKGIDPEKILAITFTNRASNEMRTRINNVKIAVHTFHQFCYQTLKKFSEYTYKIVDDDLPFNEEKLLQIARYKNSNFKEKKPKYYERYQNYLDEQNMKDFDDLLIDFHHCFHKIKHHINYTHIFVDEFQDTNHLQYLIIKKMKEKDTRIFCVGDPDQSIYRFRGAEDKIIELFVKEFHAKIFTLTTNYRSNHHIIKLANGLIKINNGRYSKRLIAEVTGDSKPIITCFTDSYSEAMSITKSIQMFLKKGMKPREIAVLFRNHYRSYALRETLDKHDIIYQSEVLKNIDENKINLLSIHQAKGLEFSVVFIIGLEQKSLPSYHAVTRFDYQEERRLFFVAITRAKQHLFLSHIQFNNESEHIKKSVFLNEIKRFV